MDVHTKAYPVNIDGRPAQDAELVQLAFAGFAHFTALQVRDRKVRAMDLHLARLRDASLRLFDRALPDDRILDGIRRAVIDGPPDMSLTATVYLPRGEFMVDDMRAPPSVLVRTAPPSDGPAGPLRLWVVEHERHMPGIKHVGEWAKTYYLHQAVARGFDDAAFVDRHGRLSEATIWNLVFWDGEAVVWPRADKLTGTMMGIVQRQLARMGVPQRHDEIRPADLPRMAGAAVMNSWTPGVAVTAIGPAALPHADGFMALLRRARDAEPACAV